MPDAASAVQHRTVETNGIRMHIAEAGTGPLVVMCHGFPESWYSWRHQLTALARAGYHAVAPDMRGYGQTDQPPHPEQYTMLHHVGDLVGLLDALGDTQAVIVGHDWGAPTAWNAALLRPDRFRAVAALSVPFTGRGPVPPTKALAQLAGDRFMYMLYFQAPGVAEAELERDPRDTIRRTLYSASGDIPPGQGWQVIAPKRARFLEGLVDPPALPAWLTEADVEFYAGEFRRAGFRGGMNWYRAMDRTWEVMAPWTGARVMVPALYVAGDRDLVLTMTKAALDRMPETVPNLRTQVILPGCGHWTQQERPAEVNTLLLAFLKSL